MTTVLITLADHAVLRRLAAHGPLRAKLARAQLVAPRAVPPDVVTLGSRVAYRDETARVFAAATVVPPEDADEAARRVSVLSPLGVALIGLSAGQTTLCDHADGTRHRLHIEYVLHQPERTLALAIGA